MKENFKEQLAEYLAKVKAASDAEFDKWYPSSVKPTFEAEYLKKWVRVKRLDPAQGSVFCFVDPETGDLYMPASYKVPAKGIRGNIFSDKFPLVGRDFYRR